MSGEPLRDPGRVLVIERGHGARQRRPRAVQRVAVRHQPGHRGGGQGGTWLYAFNSVPKPDVPQWRGAQHAQARVDHKHEAEEED